jgi:hypothetical protein
LQGRQCAETRAEHTLAAAGWEPAIPFLLSAILVALGLYIRVSVAETPVFAEVAERRKPLKAPVLDAIRRHPRSFLVVIGSPLSMPPLLAGSRTPIPGESSLLGRYSSDWSGDIGRRKPNADDRRHH